MVHLSNSASLYNGRFPYATHFRPGIALYGYGYPGLKPVLSLRLVSFTSMSWNLGKDSHTVGLGEQQSPLTLLLFLWLRRWI